MRNLLQILFFVLLATQICFAQWIYTNGPAYDYVLCLGVSDSTLFAGTWGDGVYRTTSGTSWTQTGLTNTDQVNVIAPYGTNLFAGNLPYAIALSTNNGTSWAVVNNGLTDDQVISLASSGVNLFAGTYGSGVFRSSNNGTSWTAVNNGLLNMIIYSLLMSGTNLFAGTYGSGIFRSTNNGASWSEVNNGLYNYEIDDLAISGTNIFAATAAGVYLSTNNGTSWNNIGLVGSLVLCLVVSDTYLFAGTQEDGVFLSTNNGTSWTAVNNGLFNYYIRDLAIYGTNLFAGTDGSGVWRRPLAQMITSVEAARSELPNEFTLDQNYPNPFNPSTTIRYALPYTTFVMLAVYNTLGQQVAQLVNEQQQAGYHDVVLRGDGLASGLYFYRLQAESFGETKKLILIR